MWLALALVLLLLLGGLAAWLNGAESAEAARAALLRLRLPQQRLRAGCVPIRIDPSGRLRVLLIRSRKHPEWFTFPAGGVERGETLQQAAARETVEEAGVRGRLGRRVARVEEPKARTVMFSLHVLAELDQWDESGRERCWFDMGVPGSPGAPAAVAAVRAALSPKPVHQRVLDQVAAV
eukprot:4858367-Prymnesium_polylepis.1